MSRYDQYPDHPLWGVPQSVLDTARKAVPTEELVNPDMAEPIADAVVAELAEWFGPAQFLALATVRVVEQTRKAIRQAAEDA